MPKAWMAGAGLALCALAGVVGFRRSAEREPVAPGPEAPARPASKAPTAPASPAARSRVIDGPLHVEWLDRESAAPPTGEFQVDLLVDGVERSASARVAGPRWRCELEALPGTSIEVAAAHSAHFDGLAARVSIDPAVQADGAPGTAVLLRLAAPSTVHIVDAATGADLADLEWASRQRGAGWVGLVPGPDYAARGTTRGLQSPLDARLDLGFGVAGANGSRGSVCVRAPGYAWTALGSQDPAGAPWTVALERGAELSLHLAGFAPQGPARVLVRSADGTDRAIVAAAAWNGSERYLFDGLPGGRYEVVLESTQSEPGQPALASAPVQLRAGERSELSVAPPARAPVELADLELRVYVGVAHGVETLKGELLGASSPSGPHGEARWPVKFVRDASGGGFVAFRARVPELPVGAYRLVLATPPGGDSVLTLPSGGARRTLEFP